MAQIDNLLDVMAALRDPETGCPWDREQDFDSIAPYTIEEAHEVAAAIASRDWPELCDELGDLLLQVVYHSRMAEERGLFAFDDVVAAICDKMIRRHPHVFGDQGPVEDFTSQDWEKSKLTEEKRTDPGGLLERIPVTLPALSVAAKYGRRAAGVGFDWPDSAAVVSKVDEELTELRQAVTSEDPLHVREELGDLLFAVANLSRHLGIEPEAALRQGNAKFRRRFEALVSAIEGRGAAVGDLTSEELESEWDRVKANLGNDDHAS